MAAIRFPQILGHMSVAVEFVELSLGDDDDDDVT